MEKLPLNKYLQWNSGSNKNLTLNQILGILVDLKYTKDWMDAFNNNIPRRKWIWKEDDVFMKYMQYVRK